MQEPINPKDIIGRKKAPLHLVPGVAVAYMAQALRNGAEKYGQANWRDKPVLAQEYVGAALRHLYSWMDGEEVASDSGIHHLAHALATISIVLDAMEQGTLRDDRPIKGKAAQTFEKLQDIKLSKGELINGRR